MRKLMMCLILGLAVVMTACGAVSGSEQVKSRTEEDIILTERQTEILREVGLPTEYNELSDREKNAITSIEQMLTYLEETYGESFVYTGYVDGSGIEKEHMTAYPENGSMQDEVTVYQAYTDGTYAYTDDYINILTRPVYQTALEEYYRRFLPEGIFYTEIRNVRDSKVPDADRALWDTSAVTTLIFDESEADKEQVDAFLKDYCTYMQKSIGMSSAIDVYLMSEEEISGVFLSDFENSLLQADHSYLGTCSISRDGSVSVNYLRMNPQA